jgi:hypothetical protein
MATEGQKKGRKKRDKQGGGAAKSNSSRQERFKRKLFLGELFQRERE